MRKKTHEEFMSELSLNPRSFNTEVLSKYNGAFEKIKCKCKLCEHIWSPITRKLLIKPDCPVCTGRSKRAQKTQESFEREFYELRNDIKIIGTYVNIHIKIKCSCEICGHIWMANPHHLLNGRGCPECKEKQIESKLATKLKEFCKNKYNDTITEYRILKNPETGRWLPYDIFIPSLNVFCEIQGSQHYYKNNTWFSGNGCKSFESQCERDNVKEKYALKHGRYVEIDTRKISNVDDAMQLIENGIGWISNLAGNIDWDEETILKTPMPN